jgi:hypothetical protein
MTKPYKQILEKELTDFDFTEDMKTNVLQQIRTRSRVSRHRFFNTTRLFPVFLSIAFIVLFIGGIYQFVLKDQSTKPPSQIDQTQTAEEKEKQQIDPIPAELPEKDAVSMLNRYAENLEFGDDIVDHSVTFPKFKNFDTKEQFYATFIDFMVKEVVIDQIDYLLDERVDGLYLVPTSKPILFQSDTAFDYKKISEDEYLLFQKQYSDLNGQEILSVTFKRINDSWFITDIRN